MQKRVIQYKNVLSNVKTYYPTQKSTLSRAKTCGAMQMFFQCKNILSNAKMSYPMQKKCYPMGKRVIQCKSMLSSAKKCSPA